MKKAELKGTPVLLFFCKRNRNDNWNVLLSTNLDLTFEQAYKIYATRWSIEVYFKEGKQLSGADGEDGLAGSVMEFGANPGKYEHN